MRPFMNRAHRIALPCLLVTTSGAIGLAAWAALPAGPPGQTLATGKAQEGDKATRDRVSTVPREKVRRALISAARELHDGWYQQPQAVSLALEPYRREVERLLGELGSSPLGRSTSSTPRTAAPKSQRPPANPIDQAL